MLIIKWFFEKVGYIVAILAIAVVAAINLNVDSNRYVLSDTQLANIEALARSEGSGGDYKLCYCDGQCQWAKCDIASDCDPRLCPDLGSQCF